MFYKQIYKSLGLSRKIISDRDTIYTAKFWKELSRIQKIKPNFSAVLHIQTDEQ